VALTYASNADRARAVAKQIDADGGRALIMQADNADPGAVTAAVEQTVESLGRIDILVNNAGIFTGGPLEALTVEQADRLWAVNVRAVFVAAQAAARHMGDGGRIIPGSRLPEQRHGARPLWPRRGHRCGRRASRRRQQPLHHRHRDHRRRRIRRLTRL
jgi:3-oxoacyl-[acyl-carrier protein] reductase